MDSQFSLRPATTDDISEILRIESQVYSVPWSEEEFRKELVKPYSQFLVLTDNETDTIIAGYLVCWMMYDECQVLNLAVAPQYRRTGLAKFMIRKIFSLAMKRGVGKIALEVRKSNSSAIFLYQGNGFSITHIRKGYYKDGEDAYHMIAFMDEKLPQQIW